MLGFGVGLSANRMIFICFYKRSGNFPEIQESLKEIGVFSGGGSLFVARSGER